MSSQIGTQERGSFKKRFDNAGGRSLATNVIAALALWLVVGEASQMLGWILWGIAFLLTTAIPLKNTLRNLRRKKIKPTGTGLITRGLLIVTASFGARGDSYAVLVAITGALLIVSLLLESPVGRVTSGAIPFAVNLPGLTIANWTRFHATFLYYANTLGLIFVALGRAVPFLAPVLLAVAAILATASLAYGLLMCADGIKRIRDRRRADQALPALLEDYAPEFAIHWDAAPKTSFQVAMWLPYLERLNRRFVIIIRNQKTFAELEELTTEHPVLLRKTMEDLDTVITPTLTTVFYVNNAVKNCHMVRYPGLRHIQLNHGDSDKAPSYNPVSRMYDRNFVAGQAALDRFTSHGVSIDPDQFRIVGRPQVEDVQIAGNRSTARPRVLYAPTWAGFNADSQYSSLEVAPTLIEELLRRNCDVIYRPHPYTSRSPELEAASQQIKALLELDQASSEREHIWGETAEVDMSIVDCFNASTAMIADISSVVPDYVYSEKPYVLCAMHIDAGQFSEEVPLAEGGYVLSGNLSNLAEALDAMLDDDPKHEARRSLKSYYLGEFPNQPYAQGFIRAALAELQLGARQPEGETFQ